MVVGGRIGIRLSGRVDAVWRSVVGRTRLRWLSGAELPWRLNFVVRVIMLLRYLILSRSGLVVLGRCGRGLVIVRRCGWRDGHPLRLLVLRHPRWRPVV